MPCLWKILNAELLLESIFSQRQDRSSYQCYKEIL